MDSVGWWEGWRQSTVYTGLSVVSGEGVNWGCVIGEDVSTGWPKPVWCSLPVVLLPQSPLASLLLAWQPLEAELKGGGFWALGQASEGTGRGSSVVATLPSSQAPPKRRRPWVLTGESSFGEGKMSGTFSLSQFLKHPLPFSKCFQQLWAFAPPRVSPFFTSFL